MFAYTVRQGQVQQMTTNQFQHSSKIVNQHVYAVMRALCHLAITVIAATYVTMVVPYIQANPRHHPKFEIINFLLRFL